MGLGFDPRDHGLLPVRVEEVAGLVFMHLGHNPPDFAPARAALAAELLPHDLPNTKVAQCIEYLIPANWKLIIENNRECYHCSANHPEYTSATYDVERDRGDPQRELAMRLSVARDNWQTAGVASHQANYSSNMSGEWYRANRTPLKEGFLTESLDGQPVAPRLGNLLTYDAGTARITTFPNYWCHANSDHAVATQVLPVSPDSTRIRVSWLVRDTAQQDQDYTLARLLPFWQKTSEQDWELCQAQQQGVNSHYYQPGPYSPQMEKNVKQFVLWYLDQLATLLALPENPPVQLAQSL
jgi:Rieske 2Fe-2S family protein